MFNSIFDHSLETRTVLAALDLNFCKLCMELCSPRALNKAGVAAAAALGFNVLPKQSSYAPATQSGSTQRLTD